jgi:hypothetical protein
VQNQGDYKGFIVLILRLITPLDGKQIILSGDVDEVENADRYKENEILVDANGSNFLKMLLGDAGKG